MKKLFFIAGFMVIGLLLEVGISFSAFSNQQGQAILDNLSKYESEAESDEEWEPTGPSAEDIRAATKVENLAVKGSREDKLISAVKNGDLKNVETCITAGAGLEARDNENMTALMRAAEKGYTDIANKLIDAGADVNAGDTFNCTALFKAADKNHVDIVKMLIAKGAAADSTFEDIFMSSVSKGNTEMVKALIVESARISYDTLYTAYMMTLRKPEISNVIKEALNKKSQ